MPKIDPEAVRRFLTENVSISMVPSEKIEPPVPIEKCIERIENCLHWETFHDDTDEAIMIWSAWCAVKAAVGPVKEGESRFAWRDKVWEMWRPENAKD